jgi:hypothetical protein
MTLLAALNSGSQTCQVSSTPSLRNMAIILTLPRVCMLHSLLVSGDTRVQLGFVMFKKKLNSHLSCDSAVHFTVEHAVCYLTGAVALSDRTPYGTIHAL